MKIMRALICCVKGKGKQAQKSAKLEQKKIDVVQYLNLLLAYMVVYGFHFANW